MNKPIITEADLHAYVDGCLPSARCDEVEAYLANRPDEAARLQAYRIQTDLLRSHFGTMSADAVPDRLLQAAEKLDAAVNRKNRPKSQSPWLQRIAAGLLVATLGGIAGWQGHARMAGSEALAKAVPLSRQAAVAHVVYSPDVRRPVEVSADQEEQLVKWLTKRLGTPVSPPKLGAIGYELIGGRLLPGNVGPVAQFMYQESSGQRLTLYVSTENAENRESGFRFAKEGAVNVFYWVDGKFGYALSGGIDKSDLANVATLVYDQLERK